jgi:hypothetical protein
MYRILIGMFIFLFITTKTCMASSLSFDNLLSEPVWFKGERVNKVAVRDGEIYVVTDERFYFIDGIKSEPLNVTAKISLKKMENISGIDLNYNKDEVWLKINASDLKALCYKRRTLTPCNGKYRSADYKDEFYPHDSIGSSSAYDVFRHKNRKMLVVSIFKGGTYVYEDIEGKIEVYKPSSPSGSDGGVAITSKYAFSAPIDGLVFSDLATKQSKIFISDEIIQSIDASEDFLFVGYSNSGLYMISLEKLSRHLLLN